MKIPQFMRRLIDAAVTLKVEALREQHQELVQVLLNRALSAEADRDKWKGRWQALLEERAQLEMRVAHLEKVQEMHVPIASEGGPAPGVPEEDSGATAPGTETPTEPGRSSASPEGKLDG